MLPGPAQIGHACVHRRWHTCPQWQVAHVSCVQAAGRGVRVGGWYQITERAGSRDGGGRGERGGRVGWGGANRAPGM